MIDTILSWLVQCLDLPCQLIGSESPDGPLMERYPLLLAERIDRWPFVRVWTRDAADRNAAKLVLHRILRGDDRELGIHSHPWWFASISLGTYVETWIDGGELRTRVRGPGSVAIHPPSYQHLVIDVPKGPCWTLALLGPRCAEWGFPGRPKRAADGTPTEYARPERQIRDPRS